MKDVSWACVKILPTDYSDYGGSVVRWEYEGVDYPDCSCGCRWFLPLEGALSTDWGVCNNPDAPRAGLLTFEHQTGRGCYEMEDRPSKKR